MLRARLCVTSVPQLSRRVIVLGAHAGVQSDRADVSWRVGFLCGSARRHGVAVSCLCRGRVVACHVPFPRHERHPRVGHGHDLTRHGTA